MDKISVIVPAYNAEKTIRKCLDTLVNQTYENIEIIVVDDGSKDNTLKIIKSYQKKYPEKIVLISRENKGIGFSRNEAIKKSTGDYFGFVDSDDYVELEMYEHLHKHLKKTKSDVVVCDYYEFGNFEKRIHSIVDFNPANFKSNPNLINCINTGPCNKLFKKEMFDGIEFPEHLKYEDVSAVLLALLKANKISKLNEPLYDYYINMDGETQTYDYRVFDLYKLLEIVLEQFPDDKKINDQLFDLAIGKVFPFIISMYAINDRELMLRYYDAGINFLNKHFKYWRAKYILKSESVYDFFKRCLQCSNILYKRFIKKRVPQTKKKVLFTNYSLCIGGAEKALINMVNHMDFNKYDVTILLQHKEGEFLSHVDRRVDIQSFNLIKSDFVLYRKFVNMLKIWWTVIINYNKYDFSAAYGTGYKASSLVALHASKNNSSWMHTNIKTCVQNKFNPSTDEELKISLDKYINGFNFRKFNKHVFVSQNGINDYLSFYPQDKDKCYLCYNFIDYKNIIKLSKEKTGIKKDKKRINLINISRHTEIDKRISRIINAIYELKDKYDLMLYLVGDGPDHQKYVDLVKEKKLEKNVKFLGAKSNPYPYYLLGDVFVLSSAFEGFPTVYTEALTLDVPIVTTDVSDAKSFIDKKYGLVCNNDDTSLAKVLDKFIAQDFKIKDKFDPNKFNNQSMKVIERLIDND